jgi:3,4-dihydroxy 2-butanone 4-phosphate synthase/GTP cyclohydrolase II
MVTIEAREGVTTGVSAADRARTMRVAAAPDATAQHIVIPGHIPPVRVHAGRMLHRAGVAEAALELARLAGSPHGAAYCHILTEDGGDAGGREARSLATRFGLPAVTTPEVLDRRLRDEPLVTLDGVEPLATDHGAFSARRYRDRLSGATHLALVRGSLEDPAPLPVVVQTQDPAADVFGERAPGTHRVDAALRALAREGRGALLYLAPGELGAGASPDASLLRATWRSHVVTQLLRDLGATSVRAPETA